ELDGRQTARLRLISKAFRDAGLPTKISHNMDAWLRAHAFFVTAMCGAIYLAGDDCGKLSRDSATLRLMTNGVREGFAAVRALGYPVTPLSLKVLLPGCPTLSLSAIGADFSLQRWPIMSLAGTRPPPARRCTT